MRLPELQLRHVFCVSSGGTPESGNPEFWDGNIQWVTPEDVGSLEGYWLRDTRRKITRAGYENCGTTLAPMNSIVLTKRAPIGQLGILAVEACSNQGCVLLTPRMGVDSRFFYYWLSAEASWLQALGRGSTFMELSTDDLKSIIVPLPPLPQQSRVADYLDGETRRLDGLVAAKERLLGIIAEKRRMLIAHAVTRGLDPTAHLRDSAVPWLGQIPEHWKVMHLKRALTNLDYGISESVEPSGKIAVLRMGDIQDGEIDYARVGFVEDVDSTLLLRPGDLVFNRTPSGSATTKGQRASGPPDRNDGIRRAVRIVGRNVPWRSHEGVTRCVLWVEPESKMETLLQTP